MKWIGLALLHIFAALPHSLKKIMANVSGWLMWQLNGRLRKVTVRNLEICFPDMPEEERTQLARRSLFELNMSILDVGRSWVWSLERLDRLVIRTVGMEELRATVENGNGAIVMAPHLGNWELANFILTKYCDVTTLYREPKTKIFGDVIRQKRERRGAKLVTGGASGCRAMLKTLKAGNVVSLLPDQVPPQKLGKFAPFFGEPTLTITLVSSLIQRTGAKAMIAYCKRLPDGKYEMVFRPMDEGVYDPDCLTSLAALNKSVEDCILECPEQYQWEYKRFKYLPNLQKRDYLDKHQPGSDSLGHRQA